MNKAKAAVSRKGAAAKPVFGGSRRPAKPVKSILRIDLSRERAELGRGAGTETKRDPKNA